MSCCSSLIYCWSSKTSLLWSRFIVLFSLSTCLMLSCASCVSLLSLWYLKSYCFRSSPSFRIDAFLVLSSLAWLSRVFMASSNYWFSSWLVLYSLSASLVFSRNLARSSLYCLWSLTSSIWSTMSCPNISFRFIPRLMAFSGVLCDSSTTLLLSA